MSDNNILESLGEKVNEVKMQFFNEVEPIREDLFRYCRYLCPTVWEAEDLAQETLMKSFARISETQGDIKNTKAYLFRTASNTWISTMRKSSPVFGFDDDIVDESILSSEIKADVKNALKYLVTLLAPYERTSLVLKEVYSFSLKEIADQLGISEGSVKSSLSRARKKINTAQKTDKIDTINNRAPSRDLAEAYAKSFNNHDINEMVSLLLETAVFEVKGIVEECGIEAIKNGSWAHSQKVDMRSEAVLYQNEWIILRWIKGKDGIERMASIARLTEEQGKVSHVDDYYYCPELMEEVTRDLKIDFRNNGHHWAIQS